jgi:hypothetical protein
LLGLVEADCTDSELSDEELDALSSSELVSSAENYSINIWKACKLA